MHGTDPGGASTGSKGKRQPQQRFAALVCRCDCSRRDLPDQLAQLQQSSFPRELARICHRQWQRYAPSIEHRQERARCPGGLIWTEPGSRVDTDRHQVRPIHSKRKDAIPPHGDVTRQRRTVPIGYALGDPGGHFGEPVYPSRHPARGETTAHPRTYMEKEPEARPLDFVEQPGKIPWPGEVVETRRRAVIGPGNRNKHRVEATHPEALQGRLPEIRVWQVEVLEGPCQQDSRTAIEADGFRGDGDAWHGRLPVRVAQAPRQSAPLHPRSGSRGSRWPGACVRR